MSNDKLIGKDWRSLAVVIVSVIVQKERYLLFVFHWLISLWWEALISVDWDIVKDVQLLREYVVLSELVISLNISYENEWKLASINFADSFWLRFWLLRFRLLSHLYHIDLRNFKELWLLLYLLRWWWTNVGSDRGGTFVGTHASEPICGILIFRRFWIFVRYK